MVMPNGAAMTAISATVIHSSIITCAVHPTSMIVANLAMIHSVMPRHCTVAMALVHAVASMLIHRLRPHRPPGAAMSAVRRSGRLHLSERRDGERQRTDRGECYHFHGISPRSRGDGAQVMDDWQQRMFQLPWAVMDRLASEILLQR